jgi:hypothetical protein
LDNQIRDVGEKSTQICVHTWDLGEENLQNMLSTSGETETAQDNIQNGLGLIEGGPGYQLFVFL